jgi:hypothetical protein
MEDIVAARLLSPHPRRQRRADGGSDVSLENPAFEAQLIADGLSLRSLEVAIQAPARTVSIGDLPAGPCSQSHSAPGVVNGGEAAGRQHAMQVRVTCQEARADPEDQGHCGERSIEVPLPLGECLSHRRNLGH